MKIKKNLSIGLAWISPWLFFPVMLVAYFREITLSRTNLLLAFALIFLFSVTALRSLSYVYILNVTALIFMLFNGHSVIYGGFKSEILTMGVIYVTVGTVSAMLIYSVAAGRVGLFGGEVNFSGFALVCVFCLALAAKRFRLLCLTLILLNLYLGGSRTLLLMTLISGAYYYFRYSKVMLIFLSSVLFLLIINGVAFLDYLLEIDAIESSGYVTDYSRLLVLADSSTDKRLLISQLWINTWTSSLQVFLLGVPNYYIYLDVVGYHPHNSVIQKGVQFGAIYLGLFVWFAYRYVPLWLASVILIYGFFLHNLWSVPVIALIAYTVGGRRY